ncbi:hypothetical protein [Pseudohongiella spirulinae]|nr:hypothetical protein [Pseudohongiella spirulinae]
MKNEELEVSVSQKHGDKQKAFNYVDMIKCLIEEKKLDEPELIGDFSDSERSSISSMISHINQEVSDFYAEEDDEET